MYLSTVGEMAANINARKTKGQDTRDRCALTLSSMTLGTTTYGPGTPIEIVGVSNLKPGMVLVKCLLDQVIESAPDQMKVLR